MSSEKNIYQKKKKEIKSKFSKKINFRNDKKSLKKGGQTIGFKTLIGATVAALAIGNMSGTNQSLKNQIKSTEFINNSERTNEMLSKEREEKEARQIFKNHLEAKSILDPTKPDPTNPYTTNYKLEDQHKLEKAGLKQEFDNAYQSRMVSLIKDEFISKTQELKGTGPLEFSKIFGIVKNLTENQQKFYRDNHTLFEKYLDKSSDKDKDSKITKSLLLLKPNEEKLREYYELLQKNLDVGEVYENSGYKITSLGPGYDRYKLDEIKYGTIAKLFHRYIDDEEYPQTYPIKSASEGYLGNVKRSIYVKNSILLLQEHFKKYYSKNSSLYGKLFA